MKFINESLNINLEIYFFMFYTNENEIILLNIVFYNKHLNIFRKLFTIKKEFKLI